jgi:predicted esterase
MRRLIHVTLPVLLAMLFAAGGSHAAPAATNTPPATAAPAQPDLHNPAEKKNMLKRQPLAADRIFSGDAFPKIDFINKELVQLAVGAYSLHPRFFDAQWNEVTAPVAVGRYGALVEIKLEDGTTLTRNVTLYKTPKPYNGAKETYQGAMGFPSAFDVPNALVESESWNIHNAQAVALKQADSVTDGTAALLGALEMIANDPARWRGFHAWYLENAWWSGLYKKLGENQDYPHLTYLPEGYDKDTHPWPLILFLHGSGERGNNLDKVKEQGPLGYIHQGHPLPFIVITPQCPEDEWWSPDRLARLLDQVSAQLRVDPKRIYVTGLSMGGFGSFDLGASYPDKIAAIAPLSGGESPELAERLKKMPTWIFHGTEDNVVPARFSEDIAHAMEKLGAPVKLTLYPGVGHGGWNVTYGDPGLYSWFLQQSK